MPARTEQMFLCFPPKNTSKQTQTVALVLLSGFQTCTNTNPRTWRLTDDILPTFLMVVCDSKKKVQPGLNPSLRWPFLQQHSAVKKTVGGQQHLAQMSQTWSGPRWPWRHVRETGEKKKNNNTSLGWTLDAVFFLFSFLIIKHEQSAEKWQRFRNRKNIPDCTGSNRWDLWVWSGQSLKSMDVCVFFSFFCFLPNTAFVLASQQTKAEWGSAAFTCR